MSKIIRFYQPGGAEVQRLEDIDPPNPGPGDVRVRVQAIGMNRSDLIFRSGLHPMKPPVPACNGAEAAGVVEVVGEGVTAFAPGDAVVVVPHMNPERGTYAEQILVAEDRLMPAFQGLSALENAAFWASAFTAYGGLIQTGHLMAGDAVVLPAASSSVGIAAIQIANLVGATPIALTRSEDKVERLRAAGAAEVFLASDDQLAEKILAFTAGSGARVVFDPVGGEQTQTLAKSLRGRGTYVLYGVMAPAITPFPVQAAFENLLTMTVYRLDFINRPEELPAARAFLDNGLRKGLLSPVIDRVFHLDEAIDAHRYMEANRQFGKIVLTVP